MKPWLRSTVSMLDRSSGVGARSANTCPGASTPAAKTRPNMICLIVGIGRLRVLEVPDKRRRAGQVPVGCCICRALEETMVTARCGGELGLQAPRGRDKALSGRCAGFAPPRSPRRTLQISEYAG